MLNAPLYQQVARLHNVMMNNPKLVHHHAEKYALEVLVKKYLQNSHMLLKEVKFDFTKSNFKRLVFKVTYQPFDNVSGGYDAAYQCEVKVYSTLLTGINVVCSKCKNKATIEAKFVQQLNEVVENSEVTKWINQVR